MSNRRVRETRKAVNAKTYKFRDGRGHGVAAQVAGEELDRICQQNGGITAGTVVDEARPEEAPLHPAFEWRDPVAAEQYRLYQARELIRSVEVVVEHGETTRQQQVYVHVPEKVEGKVQGYQPVSVVVETPDWYALALASTERKLVEAEESLRKLKEAAADSSKRDRIAPIEALIQSARAMTQAAHALH